MSLTKADLTWVVGISFADIPLMISGLQTVGIWKFDGMSPSGLVPDSDPKSDSTDAVDTDALGIGDKAVTCWDPNMASLEEDADSTLCESKS